jgi:hypothetical protein
MLKFKRIIVSAVSALLVVTISSPVQASENDECGFGRTWDFEVEEDVCIPMRWTLDFSSDSFDNMLYSYLTADTSDSPDVSEISIELNCRNAKSFNVYIFGDDDLYAWTNNRGIGTALMTFDNGKIQKFTYKRTYDSSQIYFLQPKLVAKSIYRAKRRFNLKFYTFSGPTVAYFPAVDMSETALRFKRANCPIG